MGDWGLGLGIGDWGLGVGDWGLGVRRTGSEDLPNPQPQPQPLFSVYDFNLLDLVSACDPINNIHSFRYLAKYRVPPVKMWLG